MRKYLVDTNVFLRFLLKDSRQLHQQSKKYFLRAKKGKISLILLPPVIFEIDYVLRGVYSLSRKERAEILSTLVKSPDLEVKEREILIEAVERYKKLKVDLFDLYLAEKAKKEKVEILSFDQDFKRIK